MDTSGSQTLTGVSKEISADIYVRAIPKIFWMAFFLMLIGTVIDIIGGTTQTTT